jgi:hypothetical protein
MEDIDKAYLPAAGHDWALPLYDPLVKFLGGDKARKILFDQAVGLSLRRVPDLLRQSNGPSGRGSRLGARRNRSQLG